jgi:drug/metabolite transporter (DMT)-like permease
MALIWGLNISVVKYATTLMPPLAFNALRVLIAAAALLLIGAAARKPWPSRGDALRLFGLGILGNGFYQILFVTGVDLTKAGNAALVLAATPAIIALFSWMRGLEHPSGRSIMGIAVSIGGVLLIVGMSAFAATRESLLGDSLMLISCVCWALFTVLLKPYLSRTHSMHVAALTMCGGVAPMFIAAAGDLAATDWLAVPATAWLAMVFSGIGALVLAYSLWYRGVRILGPTRTAMYANLQPAVALLFAWILLSEVPTGIQLVGAAGIISGLLLARS